MFEKNGEVKIFKENRSANEKTANENLERYTIDDLVKESSDKKNDIHGDFRLEKNNKEKK